VKYYNLERNRKKERERDRGVEKKKENLFNYYGTSVSRKKNTGRQTKTTSALDDRIKRLPLFFYLDAHTLASNMSTSNADNSSEDKDDAYYAQLLARVDDTISDSRARQADEMPLTMHLANNHSLVGLFLFDPQDSLAHGKRFTILYFSIVFIMFFSLVARPQSGLKDGFTGTWLITTILWQALHVGCKHSLRRIEFSQKHLIWPYGIVAVCILLSTICLVFIASFGKDEPDQLTVGFTIFLSTWITNWLVEMGVCYGFLMTYPDFYLGVEIGSAQQQNYMRSDGDDFTNGPAGAGTVTNL
jgi:hypothetical protein